MDGGQEYTVGIYALAVLLMLTYDHGQDETERFDWQRFNLIPCGRCCALWCFFYRGIGAALCWYVAGVVFFVNLAREIIKDCEDMEADSGSRETLPMKIGKENCRMIAYVLTLVGIVFLYIPYWQGPFSFGQLVLQSPAIFILMSLNG